MAKKKLITLAKELDFTTEQQYFEYMIDTHINGQFSQCRNLFNEMSMADKKDFLLYMRNNSDQLASIYDYYFNLL
jgi:hypothetical protein